MENIYAERINQLRSLGYDAVIVSATDPHSSEYTAPRWKQVEWLSGFTGEAGDMVVTRDHAGLWTDTRFFIQANMQLKGTGVALHKTRVPEQVLIPDWLAGKFPETPISVAVDGLCQSVSAVDNLREKLERAYGKEGFKIVDVPDMLSRIWADRPEIPHTEINVLDARYPGESSKERISWLRDAVKKSGCDSIFISALDQIAWLLNVRASDIDYNPYVISYLLVTRNNVTWIVRNATEVPELPGVNSVDYGCLEDVISVNASDCGRMMVDPSSLNYHVFKMLEGILPEGAINCAASPVVLRKALKNKTEIEGLRRAFIEDGVALEKFLYWLETRVAAGDKITEWDASKKLSLLRSVNDNFRGNSFQNISAYGPNAALPHYNTPEENSAVIARKGFYLIDSGGHYLYGTTDTTRTVPMASGRWSYSRQDRTDYTLVLKGMIDLTLAVFPRGTAGCHIDSLCREAMWRGHLNFGHGTGHGIGFYLGVHEGPQDLRQDFRQQSLFPGMVTSNEPGLYREGRHGIRHENVVLCCEDGSNEFGDWLRFETLTCCHIDTSVVNWDLLTKEERKWLKSYNRKVYKTLKDKLEPEVARWLRKKCCRCF